MRTVQNSTTARVSHSARIPSSLLLLGLLCASATFGQSVCIPTVGAVPALSGPPNWYDCSAGIPQYWPSPDDPRWRGSFQQTFFGTSGSHHLTFRALRHGSGASAALYLSWQIQADPSLDNGIDNLFVGFGPQGGEPDIVLQVFPFITAGDREAALPEPLLPPTAWVRDSVTDSLVAQPAPPAWLYQAPPACCSGSFPGCAAACAGCGDFLDCGDAAECLDCTVCTACVDSAGCSGCGQGSATRVWRRQIGAGPDGEWAIQMRVPIQSGYDNGIDLQDEFKMWFQANVKVPDDASCEADGCITLFTYPDGLVWDDPCFPDDSGPGCPAGPPEDVFEGTSSASWGDFRRDLNPPDLDCLTGVSLIASDVGVDTAANCSNPATSLSSSIDLLDATGNPETNTFCARPLNETGAAIAAGDVSATFRIANWGTQPDWNDVPDPLTSLWTRINPTPATGLAIADGTKGALTFDLALTLNDSTSEFDVCHFEFDNPADRPASCTFGPTRRRHQCMLVELTGAGPFSVSSVYRNMNFVDASVFERDAEVSIAGIEPNGDRDVYLYVQTTNMPAQVEPLPDGDQKPAPGVRRDITGAVASRPDQVSCRPEPLEKPLYGKLRDVMPTYVVHAYRDTGRTTRVNDKTYTVLRPQGSFGYFVRHEGELAGWQHELSGAAVEIAPKYFKVAAVPEGGSKTVTTRIEALEQHAEEGRWSLSLHAGFNDPQSPLSVAVDGGLSLGLDLEYVISDLLAVELYLGFDQFDGKGDAGDLDATHLSVDLRRYFGAGAPRPFVLAGVGTYDLSPGPSEFGFQVGGGYQWPLWPSTDIEVEARYHSVDSSPSVDWLAMHVGLRFRF